MILFRGIFQWVLSVHPTSSFRMEFWSEGEREGREFSSQTCSCYHNLIVKVGVLLPFCSCCSCLVHAYVIVVFIGMLVCMLGMLGRV